MVWKRNVENEQPRTNTTVNWADLVQIQRENEKWLHFQRHLIYEFMNFWHIHKRVNKKWEIKGK